MESAVSPVARSSRAHRAFHEPLPASERPSLLSGAAALPLACAMCAAGTAAYVVANDPGTGDAGLTPCPIRMVTGRWCPGCGLTRATHHLFRGDLAQALSYHLFVPFVLAALVLLWVVWLRVSIGRGVPAWIVALRPRAYAGAGVVLALFTVVRNLDGFAVLRGG